MATRPRNQARRSAPVPWLSIAGLAAIAICGLALVAGSLGWLGSDAAPSAGPPPGSVSVPVAGRPLQAYQALELEDLLDPATGALAVVYLPEDSILPETITDPRELLGRVLGRDKAPGRVFRAPDLLPEGTRPGIVAGIPAGKVALRIETGKVTGTVGLRRGDRFDLVATWRRPERDGVKRPYSGVPGTARAEVDVVARDAAVVEPISRRQLPAAPGGRPGATVEEMVVAVAPDEIPGVTEALELATRVDCVPRSGRPGLRADLENQDEVSRSASRVGRGSFGRQRHTVVETIQGAERSLLEVPGAVSPSGLRDLPSLAGGPAVEPGS